MASKKGTLERAVEEQEVYPTTTRRVRSSEIMGKPRGTITPDQYDQWRGQNEAATKADIEDTDAAIDISGKNFRNRMSDYKRGGKVAKYSKGGKVISSKDS